MPYKLEPIGHGRALACYTYYPSKMDEWSDDESDFSDSDLDSDESDLDSSEDEETELRSSESSTTDDEVQPRDDKRPIDQVVERGDAIQQETCKKLRRLDSQHSDAQMAAEK